MNAGEVRRRFMPEFARGLSPVHISGLPVCTDTWPYDWEAVPRTLRGVWISLVQKDEGHTKVGELTLVEAANNIRSFFHTHLCTTLSYHTY